MSDGVKRRPYRSQRRQEAARQTRARILDAARDLFVERGFAGATVAAVAERAGVAAETVYATFGSKAALLEALVQHAARGPEDAPILQQSGPAAVATATDQREQLRRFAVDIAGRVERVGPLMAVLAEAARGEPALAARRRDLHAMRRRNLRALVDMLAANGPLKVPPDEATDTVWALTSPELYSLLTGARGWSRARWARWLEGTLAAILLPEGTAP